LIDYYRLRFQLEFNVRDAKQYWGLEDFMNVNARPVYNGANLALFMVNVSHALIRPMRTQWSAFSVNDLKAYAITGRVGGSMVVFNRARRRYFEEMSVRSMPSLRAAFSSESRRPEYSLYLSEISAK
jgi:hypothetical protein